MNRFIFIGTPSIPKGKDKKERPKFNPVYTKESSTWDTGKVKFGVKQSNNNIGFVEIGGGMPISEKLQAKHPISYKDNGEEVEIPWKNRFDEEIVENVPFYRQYQTNITGDTHVFITEYDMRKHLSEELPKLSSDTKIKVTGQVKSNEYNGRISQIFQIQNVWLADEDEKPSATLEMDLLYHNSGVEQRDDEQILDVVAYYEDYFGKEDGTMCVPISVCFNGTKLDMTNEKHQKMWDSRVALLEPETDNFVKARWVVKYLNGSEEVEFTEEMLTEAQALEIEMGMATLEDFKPSNGTFGGNKVEYRLVRPVLKKLGKLDFSNGYIDTELDEEDFSIKIRKAVETEESIDNMEKNDVTSDMNDVDVDDDDLF